MKLITIATVTLVVLPAVPPCAAEKTELRHEAAGTLPRTWPDQARQEDGEENLERWSSAMPDPVEYSESIQRRSKLPEFPEPGADTDAVPLEWREIGSGIFHDDGNPPGSQLHFAGRLSEAQYAFDETQGRWTLYVGSVEGGLWKLRHVGVLSFWVPISGALNGSPSVGAFVVDRSDSSRIVIGTGDPWRRVGNGAYRTLDGGSVWTQASGWGATRTYRIRQDRGNDNVLLAATDTGVRRSTNFGATWLQVFPGEATDVVQDPANNLRWLAGVQQTGLVESTDGGLTWSSFGTGIPAPVDRFSIEFSQSDPQWVFAVVSGHNQCFNATMGWVGGILPQYDLICAGNAHCNTGDTCQPRFPALLMNGIYRSADGGATWEAIDVVDDISWAQAFHTTALAVDPDNPDRVFVGMGGWQYTDNATAPADLGFPDVQWHRTTRDPTECSGVPNTVACDLEILHADNTSYTFVPEVADPGNTTVIVTNDGGYFRYDHATNTQDGEGNFWGLNVAEVTSLPGTFAASWRQPDLMLSGLQDNGIVRVDPNEPEQVRYAGGQDGGAVNFSRDNDTHVFFSSGLAFRRQMSGAPPWDEPAWDDVNCFLPQEGYAVVVSSDLTPDREGLPLMYTNDDQFLWYQLLGPGCSWAEVHLNPLQLLDDLDSDGNADELVIRHFDMAHNPACRIFYVTGRWDPRLVVVDDCAGEAMGALSSEERTPPVSLMTGVEPIIYADRSALQPSTVYYVTGGARPSRTFMSTDAGVSWIDVTGDLASKAPGESFLELVGNPLNLNQLFLATNLGVWRTDNALSASPTWYLYMAGLPEVVDARGLEFAHDNAFEPALRLATRGRGFWQRSVRNPFGGAVPSGFEGANHPLLMDRLDLLGNEIKLSWSPSCSTGDTDYAVYEGDLSTHQFDDHFPSTCSTGGATETIMQPAFDLSYYLIAPIAGGQAPTEGSLGANGSGELRARANGACYTVEQNGCP